MHAPYCAVVVLLCAIVVAQQQDVCSDTLVTSGNSVLNTNHINTLVADHNAQRRRVNPYANVMPLLTWNAALAAYAQQLVDACPTADATPTDQLTNQQGIALLGENYVRGDSHSFSLDGGAGSHAMLDWVQVAEYWRHPSTCEAGHNCLPYMQVVDAQATQFGCGYKQCGSTGPRHLWRCLYNHAQVANAQPYATGGTASICQLGNTPPPPPSTQVNQPPNPTPAPLPLCELEAQVSSGRALGTCLQTAAGTAPTLNGKPMCAMVAINITTCVAAFAAANANCPSAAARSQEFALGPKSCTDPNSEGALQVKAICAEGETGLNLLCQATKVETSSSSALAVSVVVVLAMALATFIS
jgi:hypothetical protein